MATEIGMCLSSVMRRTRHLCGKIWRKGRVWSHHGAALASHGYTLSTHAAWSVFHGGRAQHIAFFGAIAGEEDALLVALRGTGWTGVGLESGRSATQTGGIFAPSVATFAASDLWLASELPKRVPYRRVRSFVLVVDPRDQVSRFDVACYGFVCGADYEEITAPNGLVSWSAPGAMAFARAALALSADSVLHHEVWKADTGVLRAVWDPGFTALSLRVDSSVYSPSWLEPVRLQRVIDQLAMFPELERLCCDLGYPSTDSILTRHGVVRPAPSQPVPGTVVAFHTPDPLYTAEAARFRGRLDDLGLAHDIVTVPPRENWVENCAIKPEVLFQARSKLTGPILYTDVDAFFHADPWPLLRPYADADIAFYVHSDGELLSGTVLLGDTPGARQVLELWMALQQSQKTSWDQRVLQQIVLDEERKPFADRRFHTMRLPVNMTMIFDKVLPHFSGDPVIEHLQISREVKNGMEAGRDRRRARLRSLFGDSVHG